MGVELTGRPLIGVTTSEVRVAEKTGDAEWQV